MRTDEKRKEKAAKYVKRETSKAQREIDVN